MTLRANRMEDDRERLVSELPVTERQLQLGGVSTAVLEGGDGPPIVVLHAPGEVAFWWMRVIQNLVTTHRVIDDAGHDPKLERPDAFLDALYAGLGTHAIIERTVRSQ